MVQHTRVGVRSRLVAAVMAFVMMVGTGAASVARAEAAAPGAVPLSASESVAVTGEGWLSCAGVVLGAIAIVASGGLASAATTTAGYLAAGAGSLAIAIEVVCDCAEYIDAAVGTNFGGACGSPSAQ